MADYFVGEIVSAGFNFNPRDFLPCDGRLIPIRDYTALFFLLGTQYGGDGRDTFALPDLRGVVPIGRGQGPGLSFFFSGDREGTESHTLNSQEIPSHTHRVRASAVTPSTSPTDRVLAIPAAGASEFAPEAAATSGLETAHPSMIQSAGGNQPHDNMQPTLVINYFICVFGVFPPRP
jgi:microcystin-dependent protein